MDFKNQLQGELDKRYFDMLKGKSNPPFQKETLHNYQMFEEKSEAYHQRLDEEREEFNNALNEIRNTRDCRIDGENRKAYRYAKHVAYAKYVVAQLLQLIAVILPAVISVFVGIDIFSNKEQYANDPRFALFRFAYGQGAA